MDTSKMPWPHAPSHTLKGASVVMVTAGVYRKENFFKGRVQLEMLHSELLTLARKYEWQLEAWAVFANHYHWVGRNDNSAENLESFINHLHSNAARGLNELDGKRGRKVWHNYWDTPLTYRNPITPGCTMFTRMPSITALQEFRISIVGVRRAGLRMQRHRLK